MKKILISIAGVVALAGMGAGGYYFMHHSEKEQAVAAVAATLSQPYENQEYKFRLTMPEDFKAREQSIDGQYTVTLENTKGDGIQILITPLGDDTRVIDKGLIQTSIPDLKITEEQPVDVGNDFKGLAFKSDNDAFGGASREVWFPFNGNLYQISTYDRLDPLLKAIFATWQFF